MQLSMVGGHRIQIATEGFDFLQLVAYRIEAVGTTTHVQMLELAVQADFRLVFGATARLDQCVSGNAFLRRRRWREAQIEIAFLGGELTQCPHRDDILHAGSSVHRT